MTALRFVTLLLSLAIFVFSQNLEAVLSLQSGLTQFTSYITKFPDLLKQLDDGSYTSMAYIFWNWLCWWWTVLAPSDDAFDAFAGAGGNLTDLSSLLALLEYHIIKGLHPSLNFNATPQFLPTLLTNENFTNVTGGQVVEVVNKNGNVSIYSAVKAESIITVPDAIFIGGLIQQIDQVLTIPIATPATITKAGLNDLIALLNLGGWVSVSLYTRG
jgi:hypothetical protein